MNGNIDFTNCRRVTGKAYNGANGNPAHEMILANEPGFVTVKPKAEL